MHNDYSRIGIVGAGTMGGVYAKTIRQTDLRFRAKVVAVCDLDIARARELAGPGARAYSSIGQMCDQEQLDWAYLATPDHAHRQPFIDLMLAGVPTLVEKPLATTLDDALAMCQAAAQAGVVTQVNFANRTNPVFVAAKRAVAAGQVGLPIGLYARLSNQMSYPQSNLAWSAHSTCGWFLLSHVMDLASWLTGWQAASVLARGRKGALASRGIDTWDMIQSIVTYADGGSGLFESSWVLPDSMPSLVDFQYVVHGDGGQLSIDATRQMVTLAGSDGFTYPGTLGWTQAQISWFLDQVSAQNSAPETPAVDPQSDSNPRSDAGPQPTPARQAQPLADGLRNTALLVALHRSLESGLEEAVAQ